MEPEKFSPLLRSRDPSLHSYIRRFAPVGGGPAAAIRHRAAGKTSTHRCDQTSALSGACTNSLVFDASLRWRKRLKRRSRAADMKRAREARTSSIFSSSASMSNSRGVCTSLTWPRSRQSRISRYTVGSGGGAAGRRGRTSAPSNMNLTALRLSSCTVQYFSKTLYPAPARPLGQPFQHRSGVLVRAACFC